MSEREQIDQQVARAWLDQRSPLDVPEFERAMRRCLDALDAANTRADQLTAGLAGATDRAIAFEQLYDEQVARADEAERQRDSWRKGYEQTQASYKRAHHRAADAERDAAEAEREVARLRAVENDWRMASPVGRIWLRLFGNRRAALTPEDTQYDNGGALPPGFTTIVNKPEESE